MLVQPLQLDLDLLTLTRAIATLPPTQQRRLTRLTPRQPLVLLLGLGLEILSLAALAPYQQAL